MEINGRNYHDPEIQLREIKLAVSRLPAESSLRPHFDFLIGLLDVQSEELDGIQTTVENALEEFKCGEGDSRAADLERLINFARDASELPTATELLAAKP